MRQFERVPIASTDRSDGRLLRPSSGAHVTVGETWRTNRTRPTACHALHKATGPRLSRGPVVEAPGIEPGSENFEATCVYVRVQPFASSRFAPTGELASGLFTCLV